MCIRDSSLPRTLESNEGIAGLLHQIEMFDLGLDYLDGYAERVAAVDAESVREAARDLADPDAYALAIAGPYPLPEAAATDGAIR